MTPTGSSSGRTMVRDTTSESTEEGAATREHQRQQCPMDRARERAHRMRHDQPDEADDAAGRDARRRQKRGAEIDQAPGAIHVRPQVVSLLLTKGDEVERPRAQADRDQRQ